MNIRCPPKTPGNFLQVLYESHKSKMGWLGWVLFAAHSKDVRDRAKQGCIQAAPKSLANALFIIQGHEVMTTLIVMLPFQVFVVEISWQLIL
jgi:hypothetical protein